MIVSFAFLGFINCVLCANENERKLYNSSDYDAYHAFNDYLNSDYENLQASHQNGSTLFGSRLNYSNQFTDFDPFLPYNQDIKLDQYISHFDCMIPDSTAFEKDQELQFQVPINNFYPIPVPTLSNQQSSMNQFSFGPIILPQNLLNLGQNTLISNPQPFPTSSGQIQKVQSKLLDSGNHKANNGESVRFPIERKRQYMPWEPYELDNLLKGVNEHGKNWRRIINLYKFGEGRTNISLSTAFHDLKRHGKIVETTEGKWKFINRGEWTDSVRGEGENEQIQSKKGNQEDAELDNDESENELDNPDQDKVNGVIENSDQKQDQDGEGPLFVKANKKKRWIPWKRDEFISLVDGVNIHGTNWKKIQRLYKFEQGRTSNNLANKFWTLKKQGRVTYIKGSGWELVNERDSIHSSENEPSKANKNQIQKGQNQERPFFVERAQRGYKCDYLSWKKRELDNLLKGVNKYGRSWKKIFDSYKFEGRTSNHLAFRFTRMEKMGQIVQEKGFGWRYTDSFEEKLIKREVKRSNFQ